MIKTLITRAIAAFIFLAVLIAAWFFYLFNHPLLAPNQAPVTIEIASGTGLDQFVQQLYQKQLISQPEIVREWLLLRGYEKKLKAGEYILQPGVSLNNLITSVAQGNANFYKVTIIPGWTVKDAAKVLGVDPTSSLQELNTQHASAEGLLYPDTYYLTSVDKKSEIVQRAYQKMQQILQQEWQDRAPNLPYQSSYDALIVASLIEKETAQPDERPIIAAVIINRLNQKMPLQIDPTVMYGLYQSYPRQPTPADLKKDTIYNTYLHLGLPPTPIALPSRASIHAALHPANVAYLYYFANFNGGHVFSENYDEHKQAIAAKIVALNLARDIELHTRSDYVDLACNVFYACNTDRSSLANDNK